MTKGKMIGTEPMTREQKNARRRLARTGSSERPLCANCGKPLRSDNSHDLCAACWQDSLGGKEELQAYRDKRGRDLYLQREYGITSEEYDKLLEYQDYRCAVCKRPVSELSLPLCVDHDHKHRRVRGLICHYCNRKVVGWHSDAVLLQAAADYITDPPFAAVFGDRDMPKKTKKRKKKRTLVSNTGSSIGSTTRTVRRRTTGR